MLYPEEEMDVVYSGLIMRSTEKPAVVFLGKRSLILPH